MSAEEAWQEWNLTHTGQRASFVAGYARALEDAAKELHSTNSLAYPEWLAARAAAVAPRETKD